MRDEGLGRRRRIRGRRKRGRRRRGRRRRIGVTEG